MPKAHSQVRHSYGVRHIFKSNRKDHAHLVVVFNGHRHRGWDFENSINFLKCSLLMIDDVFEGAWSYYLGNDGHFAFSDAIHSLINDTLQMLGLSKEQCTLLGASKGGFAALYIGLKYGFPNIVSSSFVGYVGSRMMERDVLAACRVMGKDIDKQTIYSYDNLLIDLINRDACVNKNIYLFLSSNDRFYLQYGQKDLLHWLNAKYQNVNVFFTDSKLAFQHDQVAAYFLQDILSITNLLTQNIFVQLPKQAFDDMQIGFLQMPNQQAKQILQHRKQASTAKPTAYNEISKLNIKQGVLFLEGLACLKYYDAPNYKYLQKCLGMQNIADDQQKYEFALGTVPHKAQSRIMYDGVFYDYTASGVATMNFEGIDLASLPCGTYKLSIGICANKGRKLSQNLRYKKELDIKSIHQDHEYRIFSVNHRQTQQILLTKRNIIDIDNEFVGYFDIEQAWTKGFRFHLEGVFIVKGVNMYTFHMGRYYVALKNKQTGEIFSYILGQVIKPNLSEKIGNPYGGYESCYFASMGMSGIDVQDLPKAQYQIFISLSHQNEIFTQELTTQLSIGVAGCAFVDEQVDRLAG